MNHMAVLNGCEDKRNAVTIEEVKCPKCGASIVAKKGKNNSLFYSCERYPDCDFSSWDQPITENVPNAAVS